VNRLPAVTGEVARPVGGPSSIPESTAGHLLLFCTMSHLVCWHRFRNHVRSDDLITRGIYRPFHWFQQFFP
jgi:hypothetical protein